MCTWHNWQTVPIGFIGFCLIVDHSTVFAAHAEAATGARSAAASTVPFLVVVVVAVLGSVEARRAARRGRWRGRSDVAVPTALLVVTEAAVRKKRFRDAYIEEQKMHTIYDAARS